MALPLTTLFDAKTTGTSIWVPVHGASKDLTFTFTSVGTTSGGTILIEETDDPGSAATASQLYSQDASGFTGGAKLAIHLAVGHVSWVRGRVSSNITGGGTITLTVAGS